MTLPDLELVLNEIRTLTNEYNNQEQEIILNERFKEEYQKVLNDSEEIVFYQKTAKHRNAKGQYTYIPNQWFILGFYTSKIIDSLKEYKEKLLEIIEPEGLNSDQREKLFSKAKASEISEDVELIQLINEVPNTSDEDKEVLKDFVTNYNSWYGAKFINRGDFMDSSILNLANVVHDSSRMIANIAKNINKSTFLSGYADAPFDLMEPIDEGVIKHNEEENLENKNMIYYGAPGTGKSHDVDRIIKDEYANYQINAHPDAKYVFRTTIYPEYSYHDFVGQIMPKTENGEVSYTFEPGIFTKALSAANYYGDRNIYLVIEEMSRGNIASIFGDIFQLLDRDENGESVFPITNENIAREIERFNLEKKDFTEEQIEEELRDTDFFNYQIKLPSNLLIYGTVNTSDQNVFVLDTAFKRRFNFKYLSVDPITDDNANYINEFKFELDNGNKEVSWISFYQAINKFIQTELSMPEDKLIGQFFIKGKIPSNEGETANAKKYNTSQIANKLLQYLWDDIEKVNTVTGAQVSLFALNEDERQFSRIYEKFKNNKMIFDEIIYKYIEEYSVIENENEPSTSESYDSGEEIVSDSKQLIETTLEDPDIETIRDNDSGNENENVSGENGQSD